MIKNAMSLKAKINNIAKKEKVLKVDCSWGVKIKKRKEDIFIE